MRCVLDPAADNFQHSKKQHTQIYNDEVYFISRKPPGNGPEWMINRGKCMYETDISEYESYEGDNEVDNDGGKEGDNYQAGKKYPQDDFDFNLSSNEQDSAAGDAAVSWVIITILYITNNFFFIILLGKENKNEN